MKIIELMNIMPKARHEDGMANPCVMFWIATNQNKDGTWCGIDWRSFYDNNFEEVDLNKFFDLPVLQINASHDGTWPCIDIFISEQAARSIIRKK